MNSKLTLLLNSCIFAWALIGAHRSKSAPTVYAAYVAAGSIMLLAAAFFYQASRLTGPATIKNLCSLTCREIKDPQLEEVFKFKYPSPESLAAAKAGETAGGTWGAALKLSILPLLFTGLFLFIAVRSPQYKDGAWAVLSFQKAAFWQFFLIFLAGAAIQGQFLVDPRYTFIDQLYINRLTNLLVSTGIGGMVGLFFGLLFISPLQRHHISVATAILAGCLFFDLIALRNHWGTETILGSKYTVRTIPAVPGRA